MSEDEKNLKKIRERIIGYLIILFPVILLLTIYFTEYLISVSNLPDWFKFFFVEITHLQAEIGT